MVVARAIYQATLTFPQEEKFGMVSQMRRAAVSIPSNIAEGHARNGAKEFLRFVSITLGSVAELETQIILSRDLNYMTEETQIGLLAQLATIGKMLRGLQRSLQQKLSA